MRSPALSASPRQPNPPCQDRWVLPLSAAVLYFCRIVEIAEIGRPLRRRPAPPVHARSDVGGADPGAGAEMPIGCPILNVIPAQAGIPASLHNQSVSGCSVCYPPGRRGWCRTRGRKPRLERHFSNVVNRQPAQTDLPVLDADDGTGCQILLIRLECCPQIRLDPARPHHLQTKEE
jgi:hypothetical protein